jgi:programmed cell death 6-interacting protein
MILTLPSIKSSSQIRLEFTYTSTFLPSDTPVKLEDLAFERAAVLFNLAALYSQLAEAEDRSNRDGLKRASDFYQVMFRFSAFNPFQLI